MRWNATTYVPDSEDSGICQANVTSTPLFVGVAIGLSEIVLLATAIPPLDADHILSPNPDFSRIGKYTNLPFTLGSFMSILTRGNFIDILPANSSVPQTKRIPASSPGLEKDKLRTEKVNFILSPERTSSAITSTGITTSPSLVRNNPAPASPSK